MISWKYKHIIDLKIQVLDFFLNSVTLKCNIGLEMLFRNGELQIKKDFPRFRAKTEVAAPFHKGLSLTVRGDCLRNHFCSGVSNNIRTISPFSFISCYSQILFHFFVYNVTDADSWKHFHKIRGYAPIKSLDSFCSNNSLKETNHV